MAFDDYLFSQGGSKNLTHIPKLAIDSFINLYSEKISMFNAPAYQIYIKKISEQINILCFLNKYSQKGK